MLGQKFVKFFHWFLENLRHQNFILKLPSLPKWIFFLFSFSQKTPLSTKDLMVLNQRSMLVAKYQDATEIDEDANAADEQDNLVIVTSRTISDSESKK